MAVNVVEQVRASRRELIHRPFQRRNSFLGETPRQVTTSALVDIFSNVSLTRRDLMGLLVPAAAATTAAVVVSNGRPETADIEPGHFSSFSFRDLDPQKALKRLYDKESIEAPGFLEMIGLNATCDVQSIVKHMDATSATRVGYMIDYEDGQKSQFIGVSRQDGEQMMYGDVFQKDDTPDSPQTLRVRLHPTDKPIHIQGHATLLSGQDDTSESIPWKLPKFPYATVNPKDTKEIYIDDYGFSHVVATGVHEFRKQLSFLFKDGQEPKICLRRPDSAFGILIAPDASDNQANNMYIDLPAEVFGNGEAPNHTVQDEAPYRLVQGEAWKDVLLFETGRHLMLQAENSTDKTTKEIADEIKRRMSDETLRRALTAQLKGATSFPPIFIQNYHLPVYRYMLDPRWYGVTLPNDEDFAFTPENVVGGFFLGAWNEKGKLLDHYYDLQTAEYSYTIPSPLWYHPLYSERAAFSFLIKPVYDLIVEKSLHGPEDFQEGLDSIKTGMRLYDIGKYAKYSSG